MSAFRDSEMLRGRALGSIYHRENRTESYVCIPPALIITDSTGATWTIGSEYEVRGWRYYWAVLRNDVFTGEYAEKIEYLRGKIHIYTPDSSTRNGRKTWHERAPWQILSRAPGYFL
jgi:hypothetical protein